MLKFKLGIFLLFVVGFVIYALSYNNSSEIVTITVKDKQSISRGESGHKYLIYCEGEVFECTDSWIFGKWNSADVYNQIDTGKTYGARVAGWRWHMWTSYRNIISVVEKNAELEKFIKKARE